jgi:ribosomal protein S18 acetylase RimI-like enzyme
VDETLTRHAIEVNWRNLALGHEVFEAEGATFVRNIGLPQVYDANFVFGVTAEEPNSIERLLRRTEQEYGHAKRLTFRVAPFTPPAFEARLALDGYDRKDAILLLLDAELRGKPRPCVLRPISDDSGWEDLAELKRMDSDEHLTTVGRTVDVSGVTDGLVSSSRLKCPPVEYVLAYENDRGVGYCNTWGGIDGVGQVEDLFVHPDYRRRGIATALLQHCVASARERGAKSVVIVVDAVNTAKNLYSALGWEPAAICREYGKVATGRPMR